MLESARLKQLEELISSSTKEELIWINGYLSGLVSNGKTEAITSTTIDTTVAVKKISIVYGTETGNAKNLAGKLAGIAKKNAVNVKVSGLDQYKVHDLVKEEFFVIVISTQGEGEPPVGAKKFYDHIHEQQLSLPGLKYAVLALGDSSYPHFCKTGEDVDARFRSFGAKPIIEIRKCDVDFEADAFEWFNQLISKLNAPLKSISQAAKPLVSKAGARKYYKGRVLVNINLNDRGSAKRTHHIEISTDEPVEYEPGDALAIIPGNRPDVVEKIVQLTKADPSEIIQTAKSNGTIRDLLTKHLNICYLLGSTIKKYAAITAQEIPDTRMDLVDLLKIYPVKDADQFRKVIGILSSIAPRLYSIASSPLAHGSTEIHITVARDRFLAQDEQRYGLCSEFLGDLPVQAGIEFYIHKNRAFRLPPANKDCIMIGPGTGVAPFRSFLFERDANGATGRNWFFFGEQHFTSDFLYQLEMQQFIQTSVLTRLDLAFSRDQQEKIYVQHRMKENAGEIYKWILRGAHVYVSGTKDPMSRDVENALIEIIEQESKLDNDKARAVLNMLKEEGRYEKDVY